MEVDCPGLAAVIGAERERIVTAMLELRDPAVATPIAESRQFIVGFLHVVELAASGDTAPRDEYLGIVIPGVRASGFPLDATLDSMIRVSMVLAAEIPPAYLAWVVGFCGDYVRRLIHAWEQSS